MITPPLHPVTSHACPSADIKEALEALASIDEVSVAFATGTSVCQQDGSEVASVTFVTQHGDVPLLIADDSLLVDDSNGGVSLSMVYPLLRICCYYSPVAYQHSLFSLRKFIYDTNDVIKSTLCRGASPL